jgi:hypothetical protein
METRQLGLSSYCLHRLRRKERMWESLCNGYDYRHIVRLPRFF